MVGEIAVLHQFDIGNEVCTGWPQLAATARCGKQAYFLKIDIPPDRLGFDDVPDTNLS